MRKNGADTIDPTVWKLRMISAELSALSNFYRLMDTDHAPPLDMSSINWGMHCMLNRLASRTRRAANQVEEFHLNEAKDGKTSG